MKFIWPLDVPLHLYLNSISQRGIQWKHEMCFSKRAVRFWKVLSMSVHFMNRLIPDRHVYTTFRIPISAHQNGNSRLQVMSFWSQNVQVTYWQQICVVRFLWLPGNQRDVCQGAKWEREPVWIKCSSWSINSRHDCRGLAVFSNLAVDTLWLSDEFLKPILVNTCWHRQ